MTRTLYLDLETYGDVDLKLHGTYRYAERAEILLVAYAFDDGPAKVLDCTHETGPMFVEWPADLVDALEDENVEIVAHNAFFDRTVGNHQGIPTTLERWRCTMARALQYGLPGGLGQLCSIFNIPTSESKKDGNALIQLFCKPPKNATRPRATRLTHPAEWAKFIDYARLDVEAMRAVDKRMPTWNDTPAERELWLLDQKINDRGFAVDLELADAAVALVAAERKKLAKRTKEVTDEVVQSTTQRDALLEHLLAEYGVTLPNLQKATVERRLNDPDLPAPVRELLTMRLDAAGTAVDKYKALQRVTASDGRVHGALQYCGAARTGRWSGRMFQPQNLMRPPKKMHGQTDIAAEAIVAGCADLLYDNIIEAAASIVRGSIVAGPGKKLVVSDLSNIEGRVLAWLAGETWKIQAFRDFDAGIGHDLYVLAYARSFDVTAEHVLEDKDRGGNMRQIGKVQELALGFQGAAGAFNSMAALYGVDLPLSKVKAVVDAWRKAHPKTVKFWYALDEAAIHVVQHGGEKRVGRVVLDKKGNWLRIRLPSGRYLSYPSPRLEINKFDRQAVTYMGINQYSRKWERLSTYGGKLAENITQAVARDVLAEGMKKAEPAGYELVLTVHDEILAEVPDWLPEATDGALCHILASPHAAWYADLPLAAGGFECKRYRKE